MAVWVLHIHQPSRGPCQAGVKRRVRRSILPSSRCMKRTTQSPRSVSATPTSSPRIACTDEHNLAFPFDLAIGLNPAHLVRRVVPRILKPPRVGTGRGDVDASGWPLPQRFMRPLPIEFGPHLIKAPLLLRCRRGRRGAGLFLQREMESLVASILLGMARLNALEVNAQFSHQTANGDSCATAVVAKGVPLSVRNARGRPNSRNVRSNHRQTPRMVGSTMRQHNTKRLHASRIVSGSQRVPSAVRNHPLKSAVQRSLGLRAAASGCVNGTTYRGRRRGSLSPSRRERSPIVLAAGQSRSGVGLRAGWPGAFSAPTADGPGAMRARPAGSRPRSPVRAPSAPAIDPPTMRRIRAVAVHPLVGRLPADRISLRELGHGPFVAQPIRDERHTLVHGAGLLPGHASGHPPDCPSHLLPMHPVYFVPIYPVQTGVRTDPGLTGQV